MPPIAPSTLTQTQRSRRLAIPPERTFGAIATNLARTYLYNSDEARRRSWENSLAMRRDAYVMSLLRERMLPTAQCPWHLEPENGKDAKQQEAAKRLTDVINCTPYLTKFRLQLLEAVWYGKYANQVKWGTFNVNGAPAVGVLEHSPVNGDKLQRQYDGTWGVQVNPTFRPADAKVIQGQIGGLLLLDRDFWRERFVIHQHELDDADFYDWEVAGQINGVGLRSRVYWSWELRDEMLSWAVSFMEKVGTLGLMLFYYEEGNATQKRAAEQAARDVSHTSALAVPVRKGGDKRTSGADLLPANPAGVEMLRVMIQDYFEAHIERLIVGQSMSAGADEANGMGGTGRAMLAANTKYQILKFDADNEAETLTRDFVKPLMKFNRPHDRFRLRWVNDVVDPASKERMEDAKTMVGMGVPVKREDLYKLAGFSKPDAGDDVVGGELPAMGLGNDGPPFGPNQVPAREPGGLPQPIKDRQQSVNGNGFHSPVAFAAEHAPAGGVTVQGTRYKGGEFIPGEVVAKATKEEKEAIKSGEPKELVVRQPSKPSAQSAVVGTVDDDVSNMTADEIVDKMRELLKRHNRIKEMIEKKRQAAQARYPNHEIDKDGRPILKGDEGHGRGWNESPEDILDEIYGYKKKEAKVPAIAADAAD